MFLRLYDLIVFMYGLSMVFMYVGDLSLVYFSCWF